MTGTTDSTSNSRTNSRTDGTRDLAVHLTLWGVPTRAVPRAVARMALDRLALRGVPGLRFAKLLGTGDGRTFTVRDADPNHWGVLTVWDDEQAADAFTGGRVERGWDALAHERLDVRMTPVASRGRWSRREPFGSPVPRRVTGPVASITRARVRASRMRAFWASVPPVSADLHAVPGMRLAVGIGEAPVGLQGTFTLWDGEDALKEFAHRRAPHAAVMKASTQGRWFGEELFARFAVERAEGSLGGVRLEPFRRGDTARAGTP